MNSLIKRFTALTCAVIPSAFLACAPANSRLMAPAEASTAHTQSTGLQVEYQPKVDILFVIDNSDSMKEHQERLKANIDRFVEAFEAHERLDFHIGVVSVFDSKRFGPVVKEFYPLGQLRPLRDPDLPGEPLAGPQYVTRAPGYAKILGETLKIGTQARGTTANDLGGPEYEESFTPVMAALDGRNEGFLREDARLAVIMITDANDDSAVSPAQLDHFLWELKGRDRDRFSTYAVLALQGCKQDPGGPPLKILEFLERSQGQAYNLCSSGQNHSGDSYGDKLAEIGQLIQQQATRLRIALDAVPEEGTLQVSFGGVAIPQDARHGWTYDNEKVAVVIGGETELKGPADAKIEVSFVPVDPRKMASHRANPGRTGRMGH
jgi:hypothetical protein